MKMSSSTLITGFHSLLLFLVSLLITWAVMSKFDFFYATWHDHVGIKEGIEKFGGQNRYKRGFEKTTRAERLRIFSDINYSVHHDGEGLREIMYQSPSSDGPQLVLRDPEVIHLEDVARLISLLKTLSIFVIFAWLGTAILYFSKRAFASGQILHFSGPLILLSLLAIVLAVFGPENVFNTLHVWVFPDDHPWFFYYQDSLMSTMMLAPRLFGWIAAAWALLSLAVFAVITFGLRFIGRNKKWPTRG